MFIKLRGAQFLCNSFPVIPAAVHNLYSISDIRCALCHWDFVSGLCPQELRIQNLKLRALWTIKQEMAVVVGGGFKVSKSSLTRFSNHHWNGPFLYLVAGIKSGTLGSPQFLFPYNYDNFSNSIFLIFMKTYQVAGYLIHNNECLLLGAMIYVILCSITHKIWVFILSYYEFLF